MIIGFLSFALDLIVLSKINYYVENVIIFPMFSLVFLLSIIYYNYDKRIIFFFFLLYSSITGIIFLPLLLCFIVLLHNKNNNLNSYLLLIIESLIIYDLSFYLFLSINDINLLIDKFIFTIPINVCYSLFLYYYVLNRKNSKYKLV